MACRLSGDKPLSETSVRPSHIYNGIPYTWNSYLPIETNHHLNQWRDHFIIIMALPKPENLSIETGPWILLCHTYLRFWQYPNCTGDVWLPVRGSLGLNDRTDLSSGCGWVPSRSTTAAGSLPPTQWRLNKYGQQFADDLFGGIFLNAIFYNLNKISLKSVPKGMIKDTSTLVQLIMAPICDTQPQWVNL